MAEARSLIDSVGKAWGDKAYEVFTGRGAPGSLRSKQEQIEALQVERELERLKAGKPAGTESPYDAARRLLDLERLQRQQQNADQLSQSQGLLGIRNQALDQNTTYRGKATEQDIKAGDAKTRNIIDILGSGQAHARDLENRYSADNREILDFLAAQNEADRAARGRAQILPFIGTLLSSGLALIG